MLQAARGCARVFFTRQINARQINARLVTRKGDTCNNAVQLAMKQCSQQVERKCCTLDQALISVSTGHLQHCQFCQVGERIVVFKVEAISLHVSEI